MKKLIILMIVLLFTPSAFALDNPWDVRLPFKHAVVKYSLEGSMPGEKTIYVKNYGEVTADYTSMTMTMFGMTQTQTDVEITTPDWIYSIDLEDNSGTKQANPKKFLIKEFNALSKSDQKKVLKNSKKMASSSVYGIDVSIEKKAGTIMGYPCDRLTADGTETWVITDSDLVMKMSTDSHGMKIDQKVTSFKETAGPSDKFEAPAGIQLQHNPAIDTMHEANAKKIIQALLEGRAPELSAAGALQMDDSRQMEDAPERPAGAPAGMPELTPEMQEQMKQMMKIFGEQKQ